MDSAHPKAQGAREERSSNRLVALDGLRGVAATVVLLHHLLEVAGPYLRPGAGDALQPGSAWWWLTQTPLKLLTAGHEAVLVFFVLSGVVVALPALGTAAFSWTGYLVSRLMRLYLPIWGSLALAAVLIAVFPRDPARVGEGLWVIDRNATATPPDALLSQALLLQPTNDINNVLWSLRWELFFSVGLILYVGLALALRRYWLLALLLTASVVVIGYITGVAFIAYLPVFLLGTIIAARLASIQSWASALQPRRAIVIWSVIVVGSLLLLLMNWFARPIVPVGTIQNEALQGLAALGAAGLIVSAIACRPVASVLSRGIPQWLGRISFSLYLVHVPIIVSITFLLGDRNWPIVALIATPVALVVAWAFYLTVERPSHRLARASGRRVGLAVANIGRRRRKDAARAES